jgi:hypothetical protein
MHTDTPARRGLRAPVLFFGVFLVVLALASTLTLQPASAAVRRPVVAKQAARWVADQIIANGGYVTTFGSPSPTDTAYAVVALRTAHVSPTASDQAIAYLETQLGTALQLGGSDAPGALAQYIMAAVVAGENPTQFGGTGAQNNLVARLVATQQTSGPDAGLFGVQDPLFDGAYRQGLALAALRAAKVPGRNAAVVSGLAWLTAQQCANGLFQAYRANTALPCDPADPVFFTGPDTNSTSLGLQGLAAYGKRPLQAQAVQALHDAQLADGGWGYIVAPGQTSDPNSTALTIQGLKAAQQKPATAAWAVPGGDPFSALAQYQLGCEAPVADRGAFEYPGFPGTNTLATVQAIPALMQRKLPVGRILTMNPAPAPVAC